MNLHTQIPNTECEININLFAIIDNTSENENLLETKKKSLNEQYFMEIFLFFPLGCQHFSICFMMNVSLLK